jgi:Fe-S cluster assembly ATP-binding protein
MLKIEGLKVSVEGKEILKNVNLEIKSSETHILIGPNGGGKTTLLLTIMGLPKYKVLDGRIIFDGIDITNVPVNERAKLGIGLMFQKPPKITGVKLFTLCKLMSQQRVSIEKIDELAEKLNLKEHLFRDVNSGFSGGELKRSELLQILCQNPRLVLLDEPESGVDLDNLDLIGNVINKLLEKDKVKGRERSGLIVTHLGYILNYVNSDKGHVLMNGEIVCSGNPRDIFDEIKKYGFERCKECGC